jgi:hypothetical protein
MTTYSSDSEVRVPMTANIPAAVFNVLVLAFFVVAALGIGLLSYAATQMKKLSENKRD